ncbi:bifunctional lysine ketoglutarate reductase /saccharopine dehydrogenase family protein [Rhodohalobacter sulfatireducens]|uniref:Bifunctional lysine ketoglutarate reductase /saccharopine dehydrogenase family protein n=1 Tax=Rhodohalobacter sulfatireducens TaxID=2911366 RepID=A0ABS9KIR0_9BACT|nr:bifunctional lysine ketoglutarate reductase /saccharopine dehydrogenase family protein [Rhodohalobacter sulfatireducens]MCG2590728.1 bifunctional lysine ketoglutarate reductase /saccharopine dehydrogenase family protein [Rhodohalobacter sulfatireducens]
MNRIGIRHEDKYKFERRTPIMPEHVAELTENGVSVSVEHSGKRIFSDQEYKESGAMIADHLSDSDLIFGVKEMPEDYFQEGKAYVFFSHVIKGQPYNMQMLKNIIDSGATLIDYEKIEDQDGQRLIFFGRFAGLAGMINTLWATGQRYKELGVHSPLAGLKQTYRYESLNDARKSISEAAKKISDNGLPDLMKPLIIAVSGDGNVSKGAMEILDLLPGPYISAEDLKNGDFDQNQDIIKVNLLVDDYMIPKQDRPFDLQHYINNPEQYESSIEDYLPNINVFVNGIYWDENYPRLITKDWLLRKNESGELNLKVIGDITCDIHGSVECTETATAIGEPVFVYDPVNDSYRMGFEGSGIAVMAVDILPSELPKEASIHFSKALKPYLMTMAVADFSVSYEELSLPDPIKSAVIVHRGKLTPKYSYLESYLI